MLLCTKIRLQVSTADAEALEFMQGKCRGLYNWWVMHLRAGERWPGWSTAKTTLEASDHSPSRKGRGFYGLAPMRGCLTAIRLVSFNTREVECAAPASRTSTKSTYASAFPRGNEVPRNQQTLFCWQGAIEPYSTQNTRLRARRHASPALKGRGLLPLRGKAYDAELRFVYSKLLHEVYCRLDKAMTACFRRCQAETGEKPGFPRLRPRLRPRQGCFSLRYPSRQMVTKAHQPQNRSRNRAVFNAWGVYGVVRMLRYTRRHAGKRLERMGKRYTTQECSRCHQRPEMPLWKRTSRCGNQDGGLVVDRDVNSAINILQRFLARLGPHTGDPVRCAEVFTALNTL